MATPEEVFDSDQLSETEVSALKKKAAGAQQEQHDSDTSQELAPSQKGVVCDEDAGEDLVVLQWLRARQMLLSTGDKEPEAGAGWAKKTKKKKTGMYRPCFFFFVFFFLGFFWLRSDLFLLLVTKGSNAATKGKKRSNSLVDEDSDGPSPPAQRSKRKIKPTAKKQAQGTK